MTKETNTEKAPRHLLTEEIIVRLENQGVCEQVRKEIAEAMDSGIAHLLYESRHLEAQHRAELDAIDEKWEYRCDQGVRAAIAQVMEIQDITDLRVDLSQLQTVWERNTLSMRLLTSGDSNVVKYTRNVK